MLERVIQKVKQHDQASVTSHSDSSQADGKGFLSTPPQTALGNQAAGEQVRLPHRGKGHAAVGVPGGAQGAGELATGFDQERARAHRGITDGQVEDLLSGRGRSPAKCSSDRRKRGP